MYSRIFSFHLSSSLFLIFPGFPIFHIFLSSFTVLPFFHSSVFNYHLSLLPHLSTYSTFTVFLFVTTPLSLKTFLLPFTDCFIFYFFQLPFLVFLNFYNFPFSVTFSLFLFSTALSVPLYSLLYLPACLFP
jgi:hypothetical protein